jgi:hypothetical protein
MGPFDKNAPVEEIGEHHTHLVSSSGALGSIE